MDTPTQWRRALARRLASQLQQVDTIEAIAVIGSVASGYADAYSDLELLVFWSHPPDAARRHAIMRHLDAELREPARRPTQDYALLVGGVPIDLWHTTYADEDAVIDTVLREYNLDLVANNRLAVMASSLPLYGTPLLERFKQRVAAYPDTLALRFLETYVPHLYLRNIQIAARRDNPTTYFRLLSELQCALFLVLLALNRVYFPTFKWIYPTLDALVLAPTNLGARLRGMFAAPAPRAVADLHAAISETLDLVALHYPQLDIAQARYGLEQPLRAYEVPDDADPAA